jgi:hypothetical protein
MNFLFHDLDYLEAIKCFNFNLPHCIDIPKAIFLSLEQNMGTELRNSERDSFPVVNLNN